MTDSSTASETTESSSSDISSTIILTVPDMKPSTVSEEDYAWFVLADRIAAVSNSMYYFNTIAFFLNFLQQFFAILLPRYGLEQGGVAGPFTRFQFFMVTMMFEPTKGVNSAFFYFVLDLLCLMCGVSILNGLILSFSFFTAQKYALAAGWLW